MQETLEFIKNCGAAAIFTHVNPDGDALGSAFSLAEALIAMGKKAVVLLMDPPPRKYGFPQFSHLYTTDYGAFDIESVDACIAVDCADMRRLGKLKDLFFKKPNLNIDHHISNSGYAQVNFVSGAPSTGEIIYDIFKEMGVPIDNTAAMAIYTAISTDTGNFTFSNTTPKTLAICSELVSGGLDISYVAGRVFNQRSLGATRLISLFIDKLRLHCGGRLAISVLTMEDMKSVGAKPEDCENLINFAIDVDTVEIAAFIREFKKDTYKISLRSKTDADVSAFAERYDGGGHKKASGYMVKGDIYDVIDTVIRTAEDFLR